MEDDRCWDVLENVSDGFFNTSAVGAIAVADSDPNVIYAGMGESCVRLDVSHGDGVYSPRTAARPGRTWASRTRVTSAESAFILRTPTLSTSPHWGHAFGPNEQRGVFRSKDGGKTWSESCIVPRTAGAIDISIDPNNPRILTPRSGRCGGSPGALAPGAPDSGLFKSTDGGDTWAELSGNPGMPKGIKGRIGVAVSPARPERVWAIVESEDGGLFWSDDGGTTWESVSDEHDLRHRPWYYSHVFADTQDSDTVWVLNLKAWKSVDGRAHTLRTWEHPTATTTTCG